MKPVDRYHAELDQLTAPDALKAKLYAIPAAYPLGAQTPDEDAQPTAEPQTAAPQPTATRVSAPTQNVNSNAKKAIPFALPPNWKKFALTAAACFAIGVFASDALNLQSLTKMSFNMASDSAPNMTATGTTSSASSFMADAESAEYAMESSTNSIDLSTDTATRTVEEDATDSTRKIIYTTRLTLESKTYDDTLADLSAALNEIGGYLEYSENYTNSSNVRWGSFIYRIPAEAYSTFMSSLGESGNVTYLSESADDVTTQYLDLEARITTLTQQRDRLWELQAAAENLTDLLEIETALSDVLYQIESYQSQLNYLATQVDYATVYLTLQEVIDYTVVEPTVWDQISNAFTSAIMNFITTIGSLILVILSIWVWLALALVAFFVYYSRKKKRNKTQV